MLHLILALAPTNVAVTTTAVGETVTHLVAIRVGADPGNPQLGLLAPQAPSSIPASPNFTSAFATEVDDLLYVGPRFARVPTDSAADGAVIGNKALSLLAYTYGVCDNQLYFDKLPRHCKRGDTATIPCNIESSCANFVSFTATQHGPPCGTHIRKGDITIARPCATAAVIGGVTTPLVSDTAPENQISLYQANLNWEYDQTTEELHLYRPPDPPSGIGNSVPMLVIVIFLSVWQRTLRGLDTAVLTNDQEILNRIWLKLATNAMLISDAIIFAAGSKAYGLLTEAKVFFPESADTALGDEFVVAYSYWFVGAVGTVCAVVLAVLFAMLLTVHPFEIVTTRIPKLMALVTTPSAVIAIRLAVDAIMLMALHITCPTELGNRYRAIVGLGAGSALAILCGRDAYLLTRLGLSRPAKMLLAVVVAAVWTHVAFFMTLDVFSSPQAHGVAPLIVSGAVAFQCIGAGAVWTGAVRGSAAGPDVQAARSHQHQL